MPYFVYQISDGRKQLTQLGVFDKFQEAKSMCRNVRQSHNTDEETTIRMVFAKDKKAAVTLLRIENKSSGPLEEWEA